MKFNRCIDCSTEFLFKRGRCPSCHSSNIQQIEVSSGTVLETVHLIATPSPFPDEYSIVLFQTPGGSRGFCRTVGNLSSGDKVTIVVDEFGPVCNPA